MPPDGPESARERGHPESVSERAAVGQRAGGLYPPGGGGRSAGEEWGRGGREELVGVPRAGRSTGLHSWKTCSVGFRPCAGC